MKTIIVIGGGAAGIMAAGQAALQGCRVVLLEKMKKTGNKIAISGQGRCNLTNNCNLAEFIGHFNREGRFLYQPFSRFFVAELVGFFQEIGIHTVTERGGRVFPASGQATDVVSALQRWLRDCGVQQKLSTPVDELIIHNGRLAGVRTPRETFSCDAAVLATGGASYPGTGSSGDGYTLAGSGGHTITPLRPALVPLLIDDPRLHSLAGLDLKNVAMRIYIGGKRKIADFGEVSFSTTGIGGPLTLTHSLAVVDALRAGKTVAVSLDLKPALDERKLDNRLQRDFEKRSKEPLSSVLRGLLPEKMVDVAIDCCRLEASTPAGQISGAERSRLRQWLKNFRFDISGHRPLKEAIITAGGVKVGEINPHTMESKKITGLYITGELLDVHGDTGGYNLQAAFSTGWLAGRSACSPS